MNINRKPSSRATLPDLSSDKPSIKEAVLLSLFFLAASVYLPLLLFLPLPTLAAEGISWLMCILSLTAQSRLAKGARGGIGHAFLLLTVGLLSGSVHLAAALGALISSACVFCHLALTTTSPFLPSLPILAYLIAALSVASPFRGALALVGVPATFMLLYAVRRLRGKVSAVCMISLGFGISAAVGAILWLILAHRIPNGALLRSLTDSLRAWLSQALLDSMVTLESSTGIELTDLDRREYADALSTTVVNYLPALAVILVNGVSLAIHSAMVRILYSHKLPKETMAPMLVFDMSAASAIVYFACLFFSFTLNTPETAMYAVAAENIMIILVPGMLITLWMMLNLWLVTRAPSCFGLLAYLLILTLLFSFSSALLPLAAAVGAALVLVGKIRLFLGKRNS